ncbi:MAG TPA: alpha/beta hydrolase-fold protein [Kofleriaceae bacterium]|nr:alpha/beta hydrolase-fold protein [Kofleriaceae bacterium]
MRLFALVPVLAAGCAQPTRPPAVSASAPPASPSPSGAPSSTAPAASPAGSPAGTSPLTLGETFHVESKILGERRAINVWVPPACAEGATRCPVLYMPDGGMDEDFPHVLGSLDVSIKNELIRPVILVGIPNTERRRDLVGPTTVPEEQKAAPHAGGADRFRQFLRDELKPAIAARYRATAESAIVGESLAGLFVLETLLVAPEMFDIYIAVDPSGWWNHQAVVRTAAARFAAWSAGPKKLYLAVAEENATYVGADVLLEAFRTAKPSGLTVRYEALPEHHNTIYAVAAVQAFRSVFAVAAPSAPAAAGAAPASPDTELPSVTLPAELDRVLRDYERGWAARSAEALARLFTDDGFVLQPGHPPVRGRDAIQRAYAGSGGPLALRALAYATAGDVGYIVGAYAGAVGKPDDGKFILLVRRAPKGPWKIAADMDNGSHRR